MRVDDRVISQAGRQRIPLTGRPSAVARPGPMRVDSPGPARAGVARCALRSVPPRTWDGDETRTLIAQVWPSARSAGNWKLTIAPPSDRFAAVAVPPWS